MDTLSKMFEKPSAVEQVQLLRKLFSMKKSKCSSMRKQQVAVCDIVEQLATIDVKFEEHVKPLVLLTSMTNSWDQLYLQFN